MTKGTPSFGLHNKAASHITCRRCGNHSFHKTKKECSNCGFGYSKRLRKYKWQNKTRAANGFPAHNIRSIRLKRRNALHYTVD